MQTTPSLAYFQKLNVNVNFELWKWIASNHHTRPPDSERVNPEPVYSRKLIPVVQSKYAETDDPAIEIHLRMAYPPYKTMVFKCPIFTSSPSYARYNRTVDDLLRSQFKLEVQLRDFVGKQFMNFDSSPESDSTQSYTSGPNSTRANTDPFIPMNLFVIVIYLTSKCVNSNSLHL
jgi:hypothetical protein